jgi:hypothetical protein
MIFDLTLVLWKLGIHTFPHAAQRTPFWVGDFISYCNLHFAQVEIISPGPFYIFHRGYLSRLFCGPFSAAGPH